MFIPAILLGLLFSVPMTSTCRAITDEARRGFDGSDLQPIILDLDGDGRPDVITPRLVVNHYRDRKSKVHQEEWIFFDLKTSRGRVVRSFFKYRYGTDEVDYWVWALAPCQPEKKGRTDLVFYAGDDTSDETVVISNARGSFRVLSRKVSTQQ
jgi:hypothetical protein